LKSIAPSRRAIVAVCAVLLYALVSRVALKSLPEGAPLKWAVVLPPVLLDLALCWLFGRTLRRGAEPLVTSFARHAHGGVLPPEIPEYTRRVTLAWTLLFAAMAAVAAWLAAFGPLRAWSLFVYAASPALVAALFLGEFAWRRVRFRHLPRQRLADMLQYLRLPGARRHALLLPLLRLHAPDDAVARRRGESIAASSLLADAAALAAALPPGRQVLNLCRDRYHFLVSFAAALIARRLCLLPPGSGDAAIRDICRDFGELCCVADHDEVPAGVALLRPLGHPHAGAPRAMPAFPAEQPAAVVFTSGSTGHPAPHVKSWGSLARGALALGRHLGFGPALAPQIIGTVPPQHMFGLEATVMLPLQWRGAVDAGRPLLPSDVKAALDAVPEPRWLMTTPLQLRACVDDALELRGALRGVISSTMPLDATLAQAAEAMWDCPVEEIYGSSETGMMALRRSASGPTWTLCEGLSFDAESGATRVRGGHLDAPFTLTDRIEFEGARSFRLLGRIGDMIKVAGKRASLEDLNARLRAVPGVADGVFYMPDGASRPVAFAVAASAGRAAIIEALRRDIDPVFLPRPLYLVDELPRAANGKITRDGLEALLRRMSAR
jgi:acyl-CoA synthetase (AMP-forming)/AMP-acid ligase II/uncharacterized membrane protein